MKRFLVIIACSLFCTIGVAQNRWTIQPDGKTIRMDATTTQLPHSDHVEMSGKMMAVVLYWDVNAEGRFGLDRSLVFPMLRTIPNNTHASLMLRQNLDLVAQLRINNNNRLQFTTRYVELNGLMRVVEEHKSGTYGLEVERTIFPTMEQQMMCEHYILRNTGSITYALQIPDLQQEITTDPKRGVKGSYKVLSQVKGGGVYELKPGESIECDLVIEALDNEQQSVANLDVKQLLAEREAYVSHIDNNLVLDTPNDVIDTEFRYAKIRASESICKTKGGYMHAPGGESYYAAIWANDQAEYVNPFFPFLGYEVGNESAINSYRHFARFMNDEWKPIPSSIIAEGDDIWNGAGDRGDGAMIAYGAARYALTRSDKAEAEELWPLIEWCLEYCKRQINDKGVVKSDKDELEGRFPAGDANLCTSTLYYDALLSAAYLGKELGKSPKVVADYQRRAKAMRQAIESHFGANVKGYETYRYYEGNDILRSWICMPLCVGIYDRAEATMDAMFKSDLFTRDGLLTAQGSSTFWDRSTLYAFRGAYAAGYADFITEHLSYYSNRRLLGDHVPYPIEAWPEGSQRHLSAESGLYCRIITEGMFGIRPTGMRSFELKVEIPADWEFANLRHIRAFGADFDIEAKRMANGKMQIKVSEQGGKVQTYNVKPGTLIKVKL
ncbi:MAG: hypothetical protein II217_05205 [Alistipes sp.]|nr:hypothetical protein [Alistipes sp.]